MAGKPAVNARDRIGRGPWQNFKGEVVAQNVEDLHSDNNKLGSQTSLTERGAIIPGVGYAPVRHDSRGPDGGCSQDDLRSTGEMGFSTALQLNSRRFHD